MVCGRERMVGVSMAAEWSRIPLVMDVEQNAEAKTRSGYYL